MNENEMPEKAIKQYCSGRKKIRLSIGIMDEKSRRIYVYNEQGRVETSEHYQYEIGSCTKVFTAALIAKMIEFDELSMESRVGQYIMLHKRSNNPTVRQLLTHTGGYGNYPAISVWNIVTGKSLRENPYEKITRQKLAELVSDFKKARPNTQWRYSNFGYGVLGRILEILNQDSYTNVMSNFIQTKFSLKKTGFGDQQGELLAGYSNKNVACGNWHWDMGPMAAAGGLRSNVEDLLEFQEYYRKGQSKYLLNQLEILEAVNRKTNTYIGMGWFIKEGMIYHSGGTGCFESLMVMTRDCQKSVVILSNYRSMKNPYQEILEIAHKILQSKREL